MNIEQFKRILAMSEQPEWIMRAPDTQQATPPEEAAQPPPEAAPQQMTNSPQQMKKVADSMLMGAENQPEPTGAPEGPMTGLNRNLRLRLNSRKINPSMPGSITNSGGY